MKQLVTRLPDDVAGFLAQCGIYQPPGYVCVEFGSGVGSQPGYLHCDWNAWDGTHLMCDCRTPPLPDGFARIIYSRNMIEHIPQADLWPMFERWIHILRSGGLLELRWPREGTPDYELNEDSNYRGAAHITQIPRAYLMDGMAKRGLGVVVEHFHANEAWILFRRGR